MFFDADSAMKYILIAFIPLFIFAHSAKGQDAICDSLFQASYSKNYPDLITEWYCKGVNEALSTKELVLRYVGDPDQVSLCHYDSYLKYGVHLQLTGDITSDQQEMENQGFNDIMIPRIKDSLGANYNQLDQIDSSWIVMSNKTFMSTVKDIFYDIPNNSDSTLTIYIDTIALENSMFQNLDGVIFKTIHGDTIQTKSFYNGVKVPIFSKNKTYLNMDFSNYTNPNQICLGLWNWTFPYPFESD